MRTIDILVVILLVVTSNVLVFFDQMVDATYILVITILYVLLFMEKNR